MTNAPQKKPVSWGWIIFWFIIFWPVGLILLFKRVAIDKSATLKNDKTVAVISYILMGLGAIYFIMALTESAEYTVPMILFGGGGLVLFFVSRNMKRTGERYKKYIELVVNQGQILIDNIASAMGVSYEIAIKDLQKMIDLGYFANARIDHPNRELVLARHAFEQTASTFTMQTESKIVSCSGCGANNVIIVGQIGKCEYCGSAVQ